MNDDGPQDLSLRFRLRALEAEDAEEHRISALSSRDLVELAKFTDEVSRGVAEAAALRFMTSLDISERDRIVALRRAGRAARIPYSPAQVSALESGSLITETTLLGELIGIWALKELLGGAVKDAMLSSKLAMKFIDAIRHPFGGAAETVERVAAVAKLGPGLSIDAVTAQTGAGTMAGIGFQIELTKARSPELEALRDARELVVRGTREAFKEGLDEASEEEEKSGFKVIGEREKRRERAERPPQEREREAGLDM